MNAAEKAQDAINRLGGGKGKTHFRMANHTLAPDQTLCGMAIVALSSRYKRQAPPSRISPDPTCKHCLLQFNRFWRSWQNDVLAASR